jgi:hypothetical protein
VIRTDGTGGTIAAKPQIIFGVAKTETPVSYYLMDVVLIKPIQEAAAPPPGELPIYTDALAPGWADWSYHVEVCVSPRCPTATLARRGFGCEHPSEFHPEKSNPWRDHAMMRVGATSTQNRTRFHHGRYARSRAAPLRRA